MGRWEARHRDGHGGGAGGASAARLRVVREAEQVEGEGAGSEGSSIRRRRTPGRTPAPAPRPQMPAVEPDDFHPPTRHEVKDLKDRPSPMTFRPDDKLREKIQQHVDTHGVTISNLFREAVRLFLVGRSARDSFVTIEGEDYDPGTFYVASQDKHGHSTQVRVSFPKPIVAAIADLIASGHFPAYRTAEGFIRDATVHRLKWATREAELTDAEASVEEGMLLILERDMVEKRKTREELMDAVETNITEMMELGQRRQLRKYIAQWEDDADVLPEPWRSRLRDRLAKAKVEMRMRGGAVDGGKGKG